MFNPASDSEGMYVYTFPAQYPCNASSANVSVSISESANAGQSTSVYFCSSDEESNLFPLLMGADAGGQWVGPNNSSFNGLLDPASNVSGEYSYSIGESTATITVTINETPEPIIGTDENSYEVNTPITFYNMGTTLGNNTWNFGDDGTSTEINPQHQYSVDGFYTVILNVENNGCVGADEKSLIITNSTGISEDFIEKQLLIYPNPGFGMFSMRFDLGTEHKVRYEVINADGKLISTSSPERVSEAEYFINLITQPAGYYFVRFYVDDIELTKKLLKMN
jgi:PKD repeat protein